MSVFSFILPIFGMLAFFIRSFGLVFTFTLLLLLVVLVLVVFWSVSLPVIVFAVVLLWLVLIEFTIVIIIPSSLVVIIPFVLAVTFQLLTNLITLFLFLVKLHSLFVVVFAGVRGAHYRLCMLFLSILS